MQVLPFAKAGTSRVGVASFGDDNIVFLNGASFLVEEDLPEALKALISVEAIRNSRGFEIGSLAGEMDSSGDRALLLGQNALRTVEGSSSIRENLTVRYGFKPVVKRLQGYRGAEHFPTPPTRSDLECYANDLGKIPSMIEEMVHCYGILSTIKVPSGSGGYVVANDLMTEIQENERYLVGMGKMLCELASASKASIGMFILMKNELTRDSSVVTRLRGLRDLSCTLKNDYDALKSVLLDFFVLTYPVYTLDRVFKSSIRTSLAWFAPSAAIHDFTEKFEMMADMLRKMEYMDARIRASLLWIEQVTARA